MRDGDIPRGWKASIDAIVRGDRPRSPFVTLGRTPDLLVGLGLLPVNLVMTVGKVATCRREHPEVAIETWYALPRLVADPLAAFPSERRDGSLVVVLVAEDRRGHPILGPVVPEVSRRQNIILSIYGKDAGYAWVQAQVEYNAKAGQSLYVSRGFAATLPQPGFAEAIPSSPGPIPADGTAKPIRSILSPRRKIKGVDER